MTERDQMFAAVLADPESDTLRLAWADCLDEMEPGRVTCPPCDGDGLVENPDEPDGSGLSTCPDCSGVGTVTDTSNADRAELIRVQLNPVGCHPGCSHEYGHLPPCTAGRADAILSRHPEWSTCPCPGCKGGGMINKGGSIHVKCGTCGGTGDLLTWTPSLYMGVTPPRPLTWRAGYPWSVGCTLPEVGAVTDVSCDKCDGGVVGRRKASSGPGGQWTGRMCDACEGTGSVRRFVPTPWAVAVVKALPVTRFVIPTDEPTREEGGWEWYALPDWLNVPATKQTFATPQAAKDAVFQTLGSLVRAAVYPPKPETAGPSRVTGRPPSGGSRWRSP